MGSSETSPTKLLKFTYVVALVALIISVVHHFLIEMLLHGDFWVQSSENDDFWTFLLADNSKPIEPNFIKLTYYCSAGYAEHFRSRSRFESRPPSGRFGHFRKQRLCVCGSHAAAMRRPCGDHAAAMRQSCGSHASTMRRPCGDHAATVRQPWFDMFLLSHTHTHSQTHRVMEILRICRTFN